MKPTISPPGTPKIDPSASPCSCDAFHGGKRSVERQTREIGPESRRECGRLTVNDTCRYCADRCVAV